MTSLPPPPSHPRRSVLLLAAGRPAHGRRPAALVSSSGTERHGPVLDWLTACFPDDAWELRTVLGYHAEDIVRAYPHLDHTLSPDWESGGPVATMFAAPWPDDGRDIAVSYTDVVYRPDLVRRLLTTPGDVVAAVDGHADQRYEGRGPADRARADRLAVGDDGFLRPDGTGETSKEFAGVVLFRARGADAARRLWTQARADFARARLGPFLARLAADGAAVATVDVAGRWAELNAPQDLARFLMGTKARTLSRLAGVVKRARVPRHDIFTLGDWQRDRDAVLTRLTVDFAGEPVAVRSSCGREDTWLTANAGRFDSVLNVDTGDASALAAAIDRVAASYGPECVAQDEILVQRMVERVCAAGVAFTRTLDRGAPYRVLNYEESGTTDGVTSGQGRELRTLFLRRGVRPDDVADRLPSVVAALPDVLDELERLLGHDALDVEFAVDPDGTVWLLQARPLAVDHTRWKVEADRVHAAVASAKAGFLRAQQRHPFAVGRAAPFSRMTDWNPAEIIGCRPSRLAHSLYRALVTDEVWARQRAEFGYRDVRPCPLMRSFAGHAYIDVRASFASFVPASLPDALATRLVDHYLDVLRAHPAWHDKVELEIVHTCLAFDFDARSVSLKTAGFSDGEVAALRSALAEPTRAAFDRPEREYARMETLDARRRRIRAVGLPPLEEAALLLDDCRSATLSFAHLARTGFVAAAFLRSLTATGLLSDERREAFLRGLGTVARSFREDAWAVRSGEKTLSSFVAEYGHLRPGTYDITVSNYASDVERYLMPAVREAARPESTEPFQWHPEEASRIERALAGLGFPDSMVVFDGFLRRAIEGREYAKFLFTRHLSEALEDVAAWGGEMGCDREALSHMTMEDLRSIRLGGSMQDSGSWCTSRVEEGREDRELALAVELPPLLMDGVDFDCFLWPDDQANFVGSRAVTGPVAVLGEDDGESGMAEPLLTGRIVLIPRADPGFDWLFCHNPLGLVTCYGGANSHMAIRAAELGLPSAIGVGEKRFASLSQAHTLRLDSTTKAFHILD